METKVAMKTQTLPPSMAGNNADIELGWAMNAYEHAETFFNILQSVDTTLLKLTKIDDELYKEFRTRFPDLKVDLLVEDEIKKEVHKAKWREFCNGLKGIVDEYNFGSLIRLDSSEDYSEKNSTLVPRAQFLAIEIARNREGCNSAIRTKFVKDNKDKKVGGDGDKKS